MFCSRQHGSWRDGNGWAQGLAELAFERSGPERILSTFPLMDELIQN